MVSDDFGWTYRRLRSLLSLGLLVHGGWLVLLLLLLQLLLLPLDGLHWNSPLCQLPLCLRCHRQLLPLLTTTATTHVYRRYAIATSTTPPPPPLLQQLYSDYSTDSAVGKTCRTLTPAIVYHSSSPTPPLSSPRPPDVAPRRHAECCLPLPSPPSPTTMQCS